MTTARERIQDELSDTRNSKKKMMYLGAFTNGLAWGNFADMARVIHEGQSWSGQAGFLGLTAGASIIFFAYAAHDGRRAAALEGALAQHDLATNYVPEEDQVEEPAVLFDQDSPGLA
jgi:hypothetical protein